MSAAKSFDITEVLGDYCVSKKGSYMYVGMVTMDDLDNTLRTELLNHFVAASIEGIKSSSTPEEAASIANTLNEGLEAFNVNAFDKAVIGISVAAANGIAGIRQVSKAPSL